MALGLARRSSSNPTSVTSLPTYREVHRMGWGIDEEYEEPTSSSSCSHKATKPVKRVVQHESYKHGTNANDKCGRHNGGNAVLWGIRNVSDLEDALGLE
eukprot:CAMPEP_0117033690 /NCGR_PEP_ID=MMETSP0472-20121206/24050_1 /TAXON_ID=693140 ORGANISM="Tiarina fusus, Strain LIS" /NCGR_SAMPLE_ID=MMETSP0472 /ASSEMBLY_ACC=CAM_ASM_000603 /LENGTH=98 /DNA_ID=CAMNT_0004742671 /DNA_START=254 /DNA_END=550 /DNA_ORIENTATION=+